ncbi:MAG: DUF1425 domain-containing protein [Opitutales bacterium]
MPQLSFPFRWLRTFAVALLAVALTGCQFFRRAPEPTMEQRLDQPLVIKGENLRELISAKPLPLAREGKQTRLQVNVLNRADETFSIAYRLRWFDARGFLIKELDQRFLTLPADDFGFLIESVDDPEERVARYQLVIFPPPTENRGFFTP